MKKIILCIVTLSAILTGCARNISSNVYSASSVGEAQKTYAGVIISARQVTVEEHERLEENGLGIVGGGIGGALAGSQFGKGRGNAAATIGGALVGTVAGAYAEKALKSQTGLEYIVALDNGEAMTVVQGPEPLLREGQRVFVVVTQGDKNGFRQARSRVVAAPGT